MVLYMVYKNTKKNAIEPENLPELAQDDPVIIIDDKNLPELKAKIDDVMRLSALVCSEMNSNENELDVIEIQVVVPKKQLIPLA